MGGGGEGPAVADQPLEDQAPTTLLPSAVSEKMSILEASHVHTVIKYTLDKLALVGVMVVDPAVQAQALTQSVGEEITRMIEEQKELEQRFEQLISAQHILRTMPNKSKLRNNQKEVAEVAGKLRKSTKQLCRNLKDNPNVTENMAKVAAERAQLQVLLGKCLSELESAREMPSMLNMVSAEEQKEVDTKETIQREKETTAAVRNLRQVLQQEKEEHEQEMRERKKTMAVLKEQLKEVKTQTGIESRYNEKQTSAMHSTMHRLDDVVLHDLETEIEVLQQRIDIEKAVHHATSDFLTRRSTNLQSDSKSWEEKHSVDTQKQDKEMDQLKLQHQRDLIQLKEIEDLYNAEVALKEERELFAQQASAAEEARLSEEVRRKRAASTIQAMWRGFKVRIGAKGGGKGKKGKGKKGKKK
mmetsp:Transcript_15738/g.44039  ORF Transcript_15738/g.44039 Transcript_15738/m.44039 type:complete len:414 (-) Transcript_15738:136-1377(-)|eukprot:CAMPEP_0117690558 /NCGR_PEP_ID=MMETSP0804-20121206/25192_1 /TAXON_ID=1074897 /ORGANISM="Tetraselmis astigmatica, Strain CCMP880" /LENGTH=413 /DNA_ID=CAMNT_0005503615 /DNA_START=237 /DNA_END=1478 /DNA_ORIENTATION=+